MNKMFKKLFIGILGLVSACSISAFANEANSGLIVGVGLDRTRVVFKDGEMRQNFGVVNNMPSPILVSSWITDFKGKSSDAFIVSPSIYQLRANGTGKGLIQLVDELPQDRESVFWLVVNTVSAGKQEGQQLKAAIGQKIKVFYRPKGLIGNATSAGSKLIWNYKNNKLVASNKTALSVTVGDIYLNNKRQNLTGLIMPYSEYTWDIGFDPRGANYSIIDEFGGEKYFEMNIQ